MHEGKFMQRDLSPLQLVFKTVKTVTCVKALGVKSTKLWEEMQTCAGRSGSIQVGFIMVKRNNGISIASFFKHQDILFPPLICSCECEREKIVCMCVITMYWTGYQLGSCPCDPADIAAIQNGRVSA